MGWVPEQITEYEYDEQGHVVRSTTYTESPWNEHERGLMLALAEWESTRCPACGGDPAECQDPNADVNNPFGTWVYDGALIECHRASAGRRAMPEQQDRRALLPQVTRRRRGTPSAVPKR